MSRNIKDLHPRLQDAVAKLKKKFPDIGIGECFRTVAEQDALYAQGRTTAGKIVTNAKGSTYSSQHQWGIAVDFFYNVKGQEFKNTAYFRKVGAYAKSIGLAWGGDWTSPVDMPHLYLPDWGDTTSKLKKQYGTFANFKKTWGGTSAPKPPQKPSKPTGGYTGGSLVDYLKSIGKPSDFASRKKYAVQYGIKNYTGTAEQNTALLNKMRGNGGNSTCTAYYRRYTGASNVLDTVLRAIGVPEKYCGKWSKRKPIASSNGIANYTGTSVQNTKLVNLAKSGKLKKA